jgi:hypothetical protein
MNNYLNAENIILVLAAIGTYNTYAFIKRTVQSILSLLKPKPTATHTALQGKHITTPITVRGSRGKYTVNVEAAINYLESRKQIVNNIPSKDQRDREEMANICSKYTVNRRKYSNVT